MIFSSYLTELLGRPNSPITLKLSEITKLCLKFLDLALCANDIVYTDCYEADIEDAPDIGHVERAPEAVPEGLRASCL